MLVERKPDIEELEAEVCKLFFFLVPLHRKIVSSISTACRALRNAETRARFTATRYDYLELVEAKYLELSDGTDRTIYPGELKRDDRARTYFGVHLPLE